MASQIAQDILQKKWSQLTDAQKSGLTRSEFQDAREEAGYRAPGGGPGSYFDRTYTLPDGSEYNSGETGKKHFGMGDYNELLNRGMSREEIDNMIYGEDSDPNNLSAELRMKDPKFKGHTGDIMDYDPMSVGNRNFNAGKSTTPRYEITRADVEGLLGNQGGGTEYSAKDINKMIQEKGYKTTEKAQSMLNERLEAMTGNPPTDITKVKDEPFIDTTPIDEGKLTNPMEEIPPTHVDPPKTDLPKTEAPATINDMQVDVDKMNNNEYNYKLGKGASHVGNVNQGNDYSININSQGGADGGGLSNLGSAAASIGLLENAFDRSQSKMSGLTQPALYSKAAALTTGADEQIANLDYITRNNPDLFAAKADMQALNTFGDIYNNNFSAGLDYQMPEPAKPIEGLGDPEELLSKFKL